MCCALHWRRRNLQCMCCCSPRADARCLQTEAALRLVRARTSLLLFRTLLRFCLNLGAAHCRVGHDLTRLFAERGGSALGRTATRHFQSVSIRSLRRHQRPFRAGTHVHSQKRFDVVTAHSRALSPPQPSCYPLVAAASPHPSLPLPETSQPIAASTTCALDP
jgi:hypothetical protein